MRFIALQDNSLALRTDTRRSLQQHRQRLVVQTLGGLQEVGEDIDELTLYIRETQIAHFHQQFTGGLNLIMCGLHRRRVIKD